MPLLATTNEEFLDTFPKLAYSKSTLTPPKAPRCRHRSKQGYGEKGMWPMQEMNSSELQDLQNRIARMEQETKARIAQLEAKHKTQSLRHRLVLGAVVLGLGVTLIARQGTTQGTPQTLTVRTLRVVDADGMVVASLFADAEGGGQIAAYGPTGKRVSQLGTDKDGWGGAWFYDADGKTIQASIYTNKDGEGVVYTKK
jgi:hypothetical protein